MTTYRIPNHDSIFFAANEDRYEEDEEFEVAFERWFEDVLSEDELEDYQSTYVDTRWDDFEQWMRGQFSRKIYDDYKTRKEADEYEDYDVG